MVTPVCFSGSKLMSKMPWWQFQNVHFCCNPSSASLVIVVNQHSPSTCCSHVSAVHDNGVKASLKFLKYHPALIKAEGRYPDHRYHRWIPDSKTLVRNRKLMIYNIKTSEKTYQRTPICFVHVSPPFLSTWEAAYHRSNWFTKPCLWPFLKVTSISLGWRTSKKSRKPWFLVHRKALRDGHSSSNYQKKTDGDHYNVILLVNVGKCLYVMVATSK